MSVRYSYFVAYELRGGFYLLDDKDAVLVSEDSRRAIITKNLDSHVKDLDTLRALAHLGLPRLPEPLSQEEIDVRIESEVATIAQRRRSELGHSAVLFLRFEGDIDAAVGNVVSTHKDLVICIEAVDKSQIAARYQKAVEEIRCSLALSSSRFMRLAPVLDGIVLTQGDGKSVYSLTVTGGVGDLRVSSLFTEDHVAQVQDMLKRIEREKSSARSLHLFSQALDKSNDDLRSFLFGWTALEIFINKNFEYYHQKFLAALGGESSSPLAKKYFDRVREIMSDKFRLQDKFIVLLSVLATPDVAENMLTQFDNAKISRDRLLHGQDVDESKLPIAEVFELFKACAAWHLERGA